MKTNWHELLETRKAVPFILIAIGMFLLTFKLVTSIGDYLHQASIKIQQPEVYRFDKYNELLGKFVKDGKVDYTNLKSSPLLQEAVSELEVTGPANLQNDSEKLCYWINSYNLLILKSVSDKYPIDSILRLNNALSARKFTVGGDSISVKDILLLKLDPYFQEKPLATFLICGGAKGYPNLINHVITPASAKVDAEKNATDFVNNPANVRYDEVADALLISLFMERYADYYIAHFKSPHDLANYYLKQKVPIETASLQKGYIKTFDWHINDLSPTPAKPQTPAPAKAEKSKNEKETK